MTAPAKRYTVELYPGAPELHEVVLASDYERLEQDLEALRDLLRRFSDAYRNTCGSAYKMLPEVDVALQAAPDHTPGSTKMIKSDT